MCRRVPWALGCHPVSTDYLLVSPFRGLDNLAWLCLSFLQSEVSKTGRLGRPSSNWRDTLCARRHVPLANQTGDKHML